MLTRNPFYEKIERARFGEASASYGGIAFRCLWFWFLCAAGLAAYFNVPVQAVPPTFFIGGACIAFVCPFLTYLFPSTTFLAGSAYSFVLGFLLASICSNYVAQYNSIVYLAVSITALAFFVTLLLYRSGIVKVNNKFRGILLTLVLTSIFGSTIMYISSFFSPFLVNFFYGNSALTIAVSVASLLIATINLVFEFDFATSLVKGKIHKKYEWLAAYGLFMTVILMFIRILNLLAKFIPKRGNES